MHLLKKYVYDEYRHTGVQAYRCTGEYRCMQVKQNIDAIHIHTVCGYTKVNLV